MGYFENRIVKGNCLVCQNKAIQHENFRHDLCRHHIQELDRKYSACLEIINSFENFDQLIDFLNENEFEQNIGEYSIYKQTSTGYVLYRTVSAASIKDALVKTNFLDINLDKFKAICVEQLIRNFINNYLGIINNGVSQKKIICNLFAGWNDFDNFFCIVPSMRN